MIEPFSLVNVLSLGTAECPGQSKPARRGTPGVFTIDVAKRGRWLGCSPSELHTEVSSDLEQLLLGFDRWTFCCKGIIYILLQQLPRLRRVQFLWEILDLLEESETEIFSLIPLLDFVVSGHRETQGGTATITPGL